MSRCCTAAVTSDTGNVARHQSSSWHSRSYWQPQAEYRETAMSSARHGPLRSGSVGPKIDTIGVPTAAAMCSGPVSPDTIKRRRATDLDQVGEPGRRREPRRAARRLDDRARHRLFPRSPQHERHQPAHFAQERRQLTEAVRAPPLVGPRRAGIEDRERRAGGLARRIASRAADGTLRSGKCRLGSVIPSAAQQAQVLVDDVQLATARPPRLDRLRYRTAVRPSLAGARSRSQGPARRPRRGPGPPTSSSPGSRAPP